MANTLRNFRYTCTTEAAQITEWREDVGDDPDTPTACKNDPAHTIDAATMAVIEVVADKPLLRADGVAYATPKPSSFGMEMCDRDFRINTSIFVGADSFEDLKANPSTNKEEAWGEMSLHGVFKDDGGNMVACTDQTDANNNCILSVWDYCAKLPGSSTVIKYEMRDGLLYVDPSLAADWNNMTETEKFGHRAYAMIAPGIPGNLGGSIAVFDSYLGVAPNRTVEALSPQATVLDPAGPGGNPGVLLRLYIFHPAGSKLSHVLRLVTYRAPGTF
jgi:hypothetical protein